MDPLGILLKGVSSVFPFAKKQWRKIRYGPRVQLSLDWQGLPIITLDRPNPFWRAVKISLIAAKDEEFVIAGGNLEVREVGKRQWLAAADMKSLLQTPIAVEKNREWTQLIAGESIVKHFPPEASGSSVEVRIILQDHHRTKVVSDPLATSVDELLRKSYS